jgi:TonB family protein
MRTSVLLLLLTAGLMPTAALAQVLRDTPPPSIQNARRERELRTLVASGDATRDTYIELANLDIMQNRLDDAVAALHGAAQFEPTVPEVQHMLATIAWQHANRDVTDPAGRLLFIREGVALEDHALTLKPDYVEAMTYKNILLRMQASLTNDPAEKARLIADADASRNRVLEMRGPQAPPPTDIAPASFSGFGEPYDQTSARLTPVRVGGSLRQPTKTHDARPTYPAQAQIDHVSGVVIIEALIDQSGSVANARILRSIPALDEAALSAVSRWQFTPTLVNGAPVAVIMTVTINFTLQTARQ